MNIHEYIHLHDLILLSSSLNVLRRSISFDFITSTSRSLNSLIIVGGDSMISDFRFADADCMISFADTDCMIWIRIPTVKLKIPGKAFLKSESRTSVTFKL